MATVQKLQRTFKTGLVNDAMMGLGVGTTVNVIDKKALQGKLTAAGFSIGQTLNGKALCLNVTDLVTGMLVVGGPQNIMKKSGLIRVGITLAAKKIAEAFDYIDPPSANVQGNYPQQIAIPQTTVNSIPRVHN